MKKLFAFLQKLFEKKFYGSVLMKFQAGKIVHFEMTPTIDPRDFQD
jgi:hypothetical protein